MSAAKVSRTLVITNAQGLHFRPADQFARLANQFQAKIELIKEDDRVDGKSVLNILTLAAGQGATVTLEAEGDDAEQAVAALAELVAHDFEENEITGQEQSG